MLIRQSDNKAAFRWWRIWFCAYKRTRQVSLNSSKLDTSHESLAASQKTRWIWFNEISVFADIKKWTTLYTVRPILNRVSFFRHSSRKFTASCFREGSWNLSKKVNLSRAFPALFNLQAAYDSDIMFPTLPRWFTNPLRAKSRRTASIHLPDGSQRATPSFGYRDDLEHDHALLESLYYSVFESRFINTRPTGN